MALILNIETSSPVCSVAISSNGAVLDIREDNTKNSHARILTVLINDLLKSTGLALNNIDAVAVSAGPGSYTGLRIGLSAAKGYCFALNKPLIAVSALRSLVEGIKQSAPAAKHFMPVIDARRMDVYTAVYNADGNEIIAPAALTITAELEQQLLKLGNVTIGGDAAGKCRQVFTSPAISYTDGIVCSARYIAALAEKKFQNSDFANLAYFEPFYLKEFGQK